MLVMILALGLIVLVGGALLGVTFGIALWLLGVALKVAVVGLVAYFVIRIVSPRTAAAIRAKFSNHNTLPHY